MSRYQQFIFEDYAFNESSKTATFTYSYDGLIRFTENYRFDFEFTDYNPEALDRALQLLFFLAGISYFKAFLAPVIVVASGAIDKSLANFLNDTYQKGLGEFFYVNQLDPKTPINFPVTSEKSLNTLSVSGEGSLIGIGGGKDSLVSAEVMKGSPSTATWSLGHRKQLQPLITTIALPHHWVERNWDKQLLEINKDPDSFNGHVPISAILAAAGTVTSLLAGYRDVVVSNESSASDPNLIYQGVEINHQYSKSLEFEKNFQSQLAKSFGEGLRYYSLLRPFTEVRIAEIFAKTGFEKYRTAFSSCNRAFTHDSPGMFWCTQCPKCAFVFLALTPFIERSTLEELFHNKNLLLDPIHEPTFRQLLGIEGDKPLECVGEVKESRAAMRLAQQRYPELNKYRFELSDDYDFRNIGSHAMPEEIFAMLQLFDTQQNNVSK